MPLPYFKPEIPERRKFGKTPGDNAPATLKDLNVLVDAINSGGALSPGTGPYSYYINNDGTSVANGANSLSLGYYTNAYGDQSVAMGYGSTAYGIYSVATGQATQANGAYSFSMGSSTNAVGDYSIAQGFQTSAQGSYAHSEGAQTNATGAGAHSEGAMTLAAGHYSHAEGHMTVSSGICSRSSGQGSYGTGDMSKWVQATGMYAFNHSYCNGVNPSDAQGTGSAILGGMNNNVGGTYSVILGGQNQTLNVNSTVMVPNLMISEAMFEYADNAAALLAGRLVGQLYRTGDVLKIVH